MGRLFKTFGYASKVLKERQLHHKRMVSKLKTAIRDEQMISNRLYFERELKKEEAMLADITAALDALGEVALLK